MDRKRMLRGALAVLTLALCAALCAAVVSLYAEGVARRAASGSATEAIFTPEGVAARLRAVAPVAGLWLAALVAAVAAGGLAPVKAAPKKGAGRVRVSPPDTTPAPRRTALRLALYAAAAALVALGVMNGGLNDVLVKAINICTECIGLG